MGATGHTPAARGRSGTTVLVGCLAVVLIAIAVILAPTVAGRRPYVPQLDDYGAVPAFAFTDERGRPFGPAAMAGHPTIVDFIFTRCDTVCPASSARMLELQERTADLDDAVRLVSFTVDPTYDTPAVLATYAKDFRADPRRWRFVTGPLAGVKQVIEGAFMTAMEDRGMTPHGTPDIWHGQEFLLVDKDLRIRGMYHTDQVALDRLARDARYLATHP